MTKAKNIIKETGILMKPFLLEAILNTKLNTWPPEPIDSDKPYKGMTRRMIKPKSKGATGFVIVTDSQGNKWPCEIDEHERMFDNYMKCPYGKPGDLLYVKETFVNDNCGFGNFYVHKLGNEKYPLGSDRWSSPLFMPKEAARIWLQIIDIKLERLQDISEQDAIWEGIKSYRTSAADIFEDYSGVGFYKGKAIGSFISLINSINGPETWAQNPWDWAISFKVLSITGKPSKGSEPLEG